MRFKKPCLGCEELFRPTGKFSKYCEDCAEWRRDFYFKNKKKNHSCPYLDNNGKNCVHKYNGERTTKKKARCIYASPIKCDLYCEWMETRKGEDKLMKVEPTPLKTPENDTPDKKSTRTRRCSKCHKVIRWWNKSGLCQEHYRKKEAKDKKERRKLYSPTTKSLYAKQ